ncbi:hypothetical protein MAR_006598 [Mya arenaria]|uniref:Myb/SANT-like DNA-binding domain-containing protein n=1 Tax=Mya arenaria TaxID=6604 RepID=A0ABY7DBJ6_MYAAR|nr:hypothetical protein MAR_006598 [Mya arenaria]
MLLSASEDRKDLFSNSAFKSKAVWKENSEDMALRGVVYSSEACEKKFRSMKYRYRAIMDACGKTGRGRSRWEYMERMDSFLCKDPAVHPVRVISSSKGI